MRQTWQLVRAELRRKWPFAAILLCSWAVFCFGSRLFEEYMFNESTYHSRLSSQWGEKANSIIILFAFVYGLILGVCGFHAGEKDGVRFFLYHHPLSRVKLYLTRYLTGLILVVGLLVVTLFVTRCTFGLRPVPPRPELGQWILAVPVLLLVSSLAYTGAFLFSLLIATELTTLPAALIYSVAVALAPSYTGLSMRPVSVEFPEHSVLAVAFPGAFWMYLTLVESLLLAGVVLFHRRRILEWSWLQRAWVVVAVFAATALLLGFVALIGLLADEYRRSPLYPPF